MRPIRLHIRFPWYRTNQFLRAPQGSLSLVHVSWLDNRAKIDRITNMATLTYKNRRGELVDVPAVAATKVKNEFGSILEQAAVKGAIAITRHDKTRAVILSYDEFQSLTQARARSLDDGTEEFDELLKRMQAPGSRKSMKLAFNASPKEIGRAAVRAAHKKR
jgi:antitoxin Phd